MSKPSLEVVTGGQFGSEAKGHVVQRLTERALEAKHGLVHVVRVAGPNAGHTGYDSSGKAWALRQIPVASVVGSNRVVCHIAAGSEIEPGVLFDEYDRLAKDSLRPVLIVNAAATLIEPGHSLREGDAMLTAKIGSTGKGIGAARADRIWRQAKTVRDDPEFYAECRQRDIAIVTHDSTAVVGLTNDDHVIIEGTQGFGLGLHTRFYPQVTSSDCRAADFMAMAGVHAWEFESVDVWVVARIYPIRVAGNSGPLKGETSWDELDLPEERTTVTKKVRRVGNEDWGLVRQAVRANGGSPTVKIALTMLDQKFPELKDKHLLWNPGSMLADQNLADYLNEIETVVGAQIQLVTTGPNTATFT